MSDAQTPSRVGSRFPLLGLALSVLVLYAIVLATLPPNPYRFAVALAAVFAALFIGITIALVALIVLSTILVPPVLSPGLTLAGPDGTPASLPTSFLVSQPKDITVTALGGSSTEVFNFRIRLIPMNATGSEPFHPIPFGSPLRM